MHLLKLKQNISKSWGTTITLRTRELYFGIVPAPLHWEWKIILK